MVVRKTAVMLVCVAAVLLQTSGLVSAKHFPLFDKFAALAQMKYPTTTLPPTTDPITTIYLPAYPVYPTYPYYPTLTDPTITDTPTSTDTGPLTDTPTTPTTLTTPTTSDALLDTDTPITNSDSGANPPANSDITTSPVTPDPAPAPATDRPGADGLPGDDGIPDVRSYNRYLGDEDDETNENEINNLQEINSAAGRANSAQREWLKRQQTKLRKQQSQSIKRRKQQQLKLNRRQQYTQKKRIQQRRRQNKQSKSRRNEVQRLKRVIQQLRLRGQQQNGYRKPIRIRILKSKYNRRYPKGVAKTRSIKNHQ